jgi:hypothetical protein
MISDIRWWQEESNKESMNSEGNEDIDDIEMSELAGANNRWALGYDRLNLELLKHARQELLYIKICAGNRVCGIGRYELLL